MDYAFLPFGDLGTSHRVSLSYHFATRKPVFKAALPPPVPPKAAPVLTGAQKQEAEFKAAGVQAVRMADNSLKITLDEDKLKFETGSFDLGPESDGLLDKLAAILIRNPGNRSTSRGTRTTSGPARSTTFCPCTGPRPCATACSAGACRKPASARSRATPSPSP